MSILQHDGFRDTVTGAVYARPVKRWHCQNCGRPISASDPNARRHSMDAAIAECLECPSREYGV